MPVSPEMSEGLRKSTKGRLSYDRDFFKGENVEDVLNQICDDINYTSIRDVTVITPTRSAIRFRKSPTTAAAINDKSLTSPFRDRSSESKDLPSIMDDSSLMTMTQPRISPSCSRQTCSSTPVRNFLNQWKSVTENGTLLDENILIIDKTELCLQNYEEERIQSVHRMFDRKREEFARHEKLSFDKSAKNLEVIQGRRKLEEVLRSRDLAVKQIASETESEKRHQKLLDDHASLAKSMHERLKEATLKDEIEQKRKNEFKQNINSFFESKQNIFATYQEIASLIKECPNVNLLPQDVFLAVQSVHEMTNAIHKIMEGIRMEKIDQADVDLARSLQDRAISCLEVIKAGVELVNKNIEKESSENVTPHVDPPSYGSASHEISPERGRQQESSQVPAAAQDKGDKGPSPVQVVSGSTMRYLKYMELLERTKETYQDLATNPSLKKYKGELQKAVVTTVNAISSQSGSHLMDKMHTLCKLITGGQVEVGNRRVSTTEHHQGRAFCLDNLAKKFVRQGEEQISSNHEAAFAVAALIVGLWKTDPVFGELLLAHFFTKCSYLVPFSLARGEGQSEEEYYTALGYVISNGVLEEKDIFLKRLTGMVRLYAAILQSALPRGFSPPHPYGVENGWMLLTQILNLEPLPDITATVLLNFLEVCGHTLQVNYGNQFQKVVFLLCHDYVPRIKNATPSGAGGPIGRLEIFLQTCLKLGHIPPPPGVLPSDFWYT